LTGVMNVCILTRNGENTRENIEKSKKVMIQ